MIQPTEAAPYYFRYINLVPPENILETLQSQLDDSISLFRTISEEKSLYRYSADKWSIRQVLNHVSDTERVFLHRAFWFARGFEVPLASFDQDDCALAADANEVPWANLTEEFQAVRLASISFFKNLNPASWNRSGIASDNKFTVRALAHIIAGHLSHHRAVLEEKYL